MALLQVTYLWVCFAFAGQKRDHVQSLLRVTYFLIVSVAAQQDLGVYDTDRDARTACTSALRIVMQYKNQSALLLQVWQSRGQGGAPAAWWQQ